MARTSLTPGLHSSEARELTLSGVPDGAAGLAIASIAQGLKDPVLVIAKEAREAAALRAALGFFAADLPLVDLPAWDCIPYDRVSPSSEVTARRMAALAALSRRQEGSGPLVILCTAASALQRLPDRATVRAASLFAKPGDALALDALAASLERAGYGRTGTVRHRGDFALRGGILDVFPAGAAEPYRLDFFGDTLESVRAFDPETQRTTEKRGRIAVAPASEIPLDDAAIARFRKGYLARFGAAGDDPLYQAVSAGARRAGMEHYGPLFFERMETVFDYAGEGAWLILTHLAAEACAERMERIADHHRTRVEDAKSAPKTGLKLSGAFSAPIYRPLAPEELYLGEAEWASITADRFVRRLSPFDAPPSPMVHDFGARAQRSFAPERQAADGGLYTAVADHLKDAGARTVILAGWSAGSADRLSGLLADYGAPESEPVATLAAARALPKGRLARAALTLDHGFDTKDLRLVTEQDILGDKLARPRRRKRDADVLTGTETLTAGDLVVHVEHGIARYQGLVTLSVQGVDHDFLELRYAGDAKLYLPVENIELLTRYGGDEQGAPLDKLGGAAWQARKSRLKERLRAMADELIQIAAARKMRRAPRFEADRAEYEAFAARFPYMETDDQLAAIDDTLADLAAGTPMDRLVCGDVGFGKTEVALRAAYVAALSGAQVAVVAPTTLLARQHYATFASRFEGTGVEVRRLSRFVGTKEAAETRAGLADGSVDVVVGTHALLAKNVSFKRLGLVVVDEEQRFGVRHKERLKALKSDVHVLTLTATPIPRTLQLALSGVRELSIIATPPVDRLATRTYVAPFDPVSVREALLREKYRGGQSFFVCPRISDMEEAAAFLTENAPEVSFVTAHGQMAATELEDRMTAFYEGRYDVLLATTIVEAGLDIPAANTLIVHRADMFGLAQLYQIRGRVGRSKNRAYAYLTTPPNQPLTPQAERRLKALQSLDHLGAGFQIASHDLDIRGGGNLLGEEQSGHVKEVGFELYQQMLEEAVASLKDGEDREESWSPQINVGVSVLIPESYVADLDVRLELYKKLSECETPGEVESFAAELVDRFGPAPLAVEHLLKIVTIKSACRRAMIAKLDAGPKGVVIAFKDGSFPNPAGLVLWLSEPGRQAKMRADQTLFVAGLWDEDEARLKGVLKTVRALADIAAAA